MKIWDNKALKEKEEKKKFFFKKCGGHSFSDFLVKFFSYKSIEELWN